MSSKSLLSILFLTQDKYPPFRPAAKAIFSDEFGVRKHRIDWLIQAQQSLEGSGKVRVENGTVYLAATNERSSVTGRVGKYVLEFANNLRVLLLPRTNNYDLIQVKDRYISAVFALIAAKFYGIPYFYWLAYPHAEAQTHEASEGYARYPLLYRFQGWYKAKLLYHILLPYADHAFVQSEQMLRDVAAHGISPDCMTPVPGSVLLEEMPEPTYTAPLTETVLYVGTLLRERRLDFLIESFAHVKRSRPAAKLQLVGKGENPEDEELLIAAIEKHNLVDSVDLVGHVPMNEVFNYIAAAAVCVSPYYPTFILNSTSPTKLIEYMALGKPVVGNDHPEQSSILNLSGAGLLSPWEPKEFGAKIAQLLANPNDALAMGKKGRAWVEDNRTNRHMADIVEQTYHSVLAKR